MLAVINDTGILVVLVAVILLFGASQIPKLARNLGEASKEFRKAHEDANMATASPPDHYALNRAHSEAFLASPPQNPQAEKMLDLSPEKLMVLLVVGLMVLGPQRLPSAARTIARGLAGARQLTTTMTDPIRASLAEPTKVVNDAFSDAVNDMRQVGRAPASAAGAPARPIPVDPAHN